MSAPFDLDTARRMTRLDSGNATCIALREHLRDAIAEIDRLRRQLAEARGIVERFVTHVEAHGADNFYSFTEHIPLLRDAKEALRAAKEAT